MGGEAGVHKETFFSIPFFKPSVVEQFQVVLDDERHNVMLQALLQKEQATYTAISVLEGMDAFKCQYWSQRYTGSDRGKDGFPQYG